eukprot:TRINITY_DN1819_c0_g1_i3.p1 TRINITY_DN1819_c0_g1~~TRINITY_DN1819_c0_g1_i3.p1  ORF type:complete len:220 (-),score=42.53 TRINITY_DN1819_c0_g1_i3:77-736(-)
MIFQCRAMPYLRVSKVGVPNLSLTTTMIQLGIQNQEEAVSVLPSEVVVKLDEGHLANELFSSNMRVQDTHLLLLHYHPVNLTSRMMFLFESFLQLFNRNFLSGEGQSSNGTSSELENTMGSPTGPIGEDKDEDKKRHKNWRQESEPKLSDLEAYVIWEKGTEMPGTGKFNDFYPVQGHFACKICESPLYPASTKFDSGCGWPAFDDCYKGSVKTTRGNF